METSWGELGGGEDVSIIKLHSVQQTVISVVSDNCLLPLAGWFSLLHESKLNIWGMDKTRQSHQKVELKLNSEQPCHYVQTLHHYGDWSILQKSCGDCAKLRGRAERGTDYRTSCSWSLDVKLYILHSLATVFFFFSWAHLRKKPFNLFFESIKLVNIFRMYVVLCLSCRYEWLQLYAHQLLRGDRGVVLWQVPSCQWASRRVGEQQGVSAGLHGAGQSAEEITQVSSSGSCRSITFSSSLRFTEGLRVWSKTRWPKKE